MGLLFRNYREICASIGSRRVLYITPRKQMRRPPAFPRFLRALIIKVCYLVCLERETQDSFFTVQLSVQSQLCFK